MTRLESVTVRALLLTLAAALVCASGADAAPTQIGTTTVDGPIAALDGWVAWSAPDAGAPGYVNLVAAHAGTTRVLPIPARPKAFDVDLGTDRGGRVVATFSRCRRYSRIPSFPPVADTGCAAKVVDLQTGRERAVGEPRPTDASDTHPSMWRGRLAFGRRDPARHKQVEQLELFDPRTRRTRRVRALRHGTVPTHCPFKSCKGERVSGQVTNTDLGPSAVAYGWAVIAPAVVGHVGYEARVDRLADGRSALLGSGFAGEACTGGPDAVFPQAPTVRGSSASFVETSDDCYVESYVLRRAGPADRAGTEAKLEGGGDLLATAPAADGVYALVAPKPAGETGAVCTAAGQPCVVTRLDTPALTPSSRGAPQPPVFE